MRLTHFSYHETGWRISEKLPLQAVNLLVGKNAVGKSKTIRALSKTIDFLLQQQLPLVNEDFGAYLAFEDNGEMCVYEFQYVQNEITYENLTVNETTYLYRDKEKDIATLHDQPINPPANKLILHVRRDTVQYPYIEKIMLWTEQACGLSFNEMDIEGDCGTSSYILGQRQELYALVESMPQDVLEYIISQAQSLDYPLSQIQTITIQDTFKKVVFAEKGVDGYLLTDKYLSKGMFRTLYLLIYMEYLALQAHPSLLLIDDLCEGLDYDRSTKLGKLVFDFCIEHGIQLIASSNDTFLMDVINLKYWNILQREGSEITSINIQNHPELFESFRFTGLSNFDFISSDYIQRHLPHKTSDNE